MKSGKTNWRMAHPNFSLCSPSQEALHCSFPYLWVVIDIVPQCSTNVGPFSRVWLLSEHLLHFWLPPFLLSVSQRHLPVPHCPSLLMVRTIDQFIYNKTISQCSGATHASSASQDVVQEEFVCVPQECLQKMLDFTSPAAAQRSLSLQTIISNLATFASLRNSPLLSFS